MRRIILCIFCLCLLSGIAGAVTLDTAYYTYVADDDHSITILFTITPNDTDGYVDTYVDGKYLDTRYYPAGIKCEFPFYSQEIGDHLLELRF